LTNLTLLYINGNQLSGTIPIALADLVNLQQLGLSDNLLTGTVPIELANLTSLNRLYLDVNSGLTGEFPLELIVLNLTDLKIDGTGICEPLDVSFTDWTATMTTYLGSGISCFTPVVESDSLALVALYNSTNGPAWTDNTNWLTAPVSSWTGITTGEGRVQEIILPNNNLSGSLPAEIGDLDSLTTLSFNNNALGGTIPIEFYGLTNLNQIFFANNNITEPISDSFGLLTSLSSLFINGNQFSGTIPIALANLVGLRDLGLSDNLLTGTVPIELANLTSLNRLYLDVNSGLTGEFPLELIVLNLTDLKIDGTGICEPLDVSFTDWTATMTTYLGSGISCFTPVVESDSLALVAFYNNTDGANWFDNTNWLTAPVSSWTGITTGEGRVQQINLPNNNLSGSLPAEIGNLDTLTVLNINDNALGGTIPAELYGMINLNRLYLANNGFAEPISDSFGSLTNLIHLFINGNQFSGGIPIALTNLVNLQQLGLSYNLLTGNIPTEIGNLTLLTNLYIDGNQFSGALPASLGNLVNLIDLKFESNEFTSIPAEIGNLTNLAFLNIGDNDFSGAIPEEIGNLTGLTRLSIRDMVKITSLPASLTNLVNLNDVDFSRLTLTMLPDLSFLSGPAVSVNRNRLSWSQIVANIPYLNNYSEQFYTYDLSIDNPLPTVGATINITVNSDHLDNTFQWFKEDQLLTGETLEVLTLTSITEFDKGEYYCLISNSNDASGVTLESESFILDPMVTDRRYATGVVSFSSERSAVFGGAQEAIGRPNDFALDNAGIAPQETNPSSGRGWKGATLDNVEYIDLSFDNPSPINTIWLYEDGAGFVDSVQLKNAATGTYDLTFRFFNEQLDFPTTTFDVSEVRIKVDNTGDAFNASSLDAVAIGLNNSEIASPSNLNLSQVVNDTIVTISWDTSYNGVEDNEFNGSRYSIERSLTPNSGFIAIDTASFEALEFTDARYSDQSAPADDYVYYRVISFRDDGRVSQYSNILEVVKCESILPFPIDKTWNSYSTQGAFGGVGTNANVSILANQNSPNQFTLSDYSANWWTNFGGNGDLQAIITIDCGQLSLDVTSGDAGFGEVISINNFFYDAVGDSLVIEWYDATNDFTEITVFKQNVIDPIQNSASDVLATNIGGQVQVDWNDNSPFETGFAIERALNSDSIFSQVGLVAKDVVRYFDSGLANGQTYLYRIVTQSGSGPSIASDTTSLTVIDQLFSRVTGGDMSTYDPAATYSGHFADYDNDGDQDILLTNENFVGPVNGHPGLDIYNNYLFNNDGTGNFTQIFGNPVTDDEYGTRGAVWVDLNHDGFLDLVTNSRGNNLPAAQDPFRNGRVYLNDQSGGFTLGQETVRVGGAAGNPVGMDFNNDGATDLLAVSFSPVFRLFKGQGDGLLTVNDGADVITITNPWNVQPVDIDNDGLVDLAVTDEEKTELYLNIDGLQFDPNPITFPDTRRGSAFGDLDNDGDMDAMFYGAGASNAIPIFYENNGDLTFTLRSSTDVIGSDITIGRSFTFFDYDNDGDLDVFIYLGANSLGNILVNNGNWSFTLLNQEELPFVGTSVFDGLSVADINGDGFVDIFTAQTNIGNQTFSDRATLYTNNGNANNYLRIVLKGRNSDTFGYGSRIKIKTSSGNQYRQVVSHNGLWTGNENVTHFGLAGATIVDSLVVNWPSGAETILTDINPNQVLEIDEEDYLAALDRMALESLYSTTGGDTDWSDNTNWLVDADVDNWTGVTTSALGRVTELNLANNNLIGTVPEDLSAMRLLKNIDLSGNQLDSLAVNFRLIDSLQSVDVSNNKLDFGDLEFNVSATGIVYNDQFPDDIEIDTLLMVNNPIDISFIIDGEANEYVWYRDSTIVIDSVRNTITIDSLRRGSMGEYYAEVTNDSVPGLTLYSARKNITAIADLDGKLLVSANEPVTSGEVTLLRVEEINGFDTVAVVAVDVDGSYRFPEVPLDDYLIVGFADTLTYSESLPTYYPGSDLWEEADTLFLETNQMNLDVVVQFDREDTGGDGAIFGIFEEEFDEDGGGRFEAKRRIGGAGVSVRRGRRSGRDEETVYDLVTHVFTDDNGEFNIGDLPSDTYRLNFQYPGYPMDTLTDVDVVLGDDSKTNKSSVEALVIDGAIEVRQLVILGFDESQLVHIKAYPNPVSESMKVEWDAQSQEVQVSIYNLLGELVKQQIIFKNDNTMDMRDLSNGQYLIKVSSSDNKVDGTFRVIIQVE
jgi:Leucine-rich repeat (LRR) protein